MQNSSAVLSMGIEDPRIVIPAIEADLELVTTRNIYFRELIPETGVLREYFDYAEPITDSPPVYHLFTGLATIGAAIGNKAYINFGPNRIYPNLWIILLAPSSIFRKTTCINIARSVLDKISPKSIFAHHITTEKKTLSELNNHPAGIITPFEFKSLMMMLAKDYNNGLKELLTEIYDSPASLKRSTIGNSFEIINPALSILSASTLSWFNESVKSGDVFGGFLSRFLFVPSTTKKEFMAFPPDADQGKVNKLVMNIKKVTEIEGQADRSECTSIYANWAKRNEDFILNHPNQETLAPFLTRMSIYTLKFALILNISEGKGLKITPSNMYRAILITEFLKRHLEELAGEAFGSDSDKRRLKVYKMIKKEPGIKKRRIIANAHIPANQLNPILEILVEEEKIRYGSNGGIYPTNVANVA